MKTKAEVQENAKRIIDEFALALKGLEADAIEWHARPLEDMRAAFTEGKEGFLAEVLLNAPKRKDGQPQMEKKGW